MKIALIILSLAAAVPFFSFCASSHSGNGKKVYADYHGVRYTRRHDGKLGRWEMYADTWQSSTGRKTLCYNADLIDSSGRHDIAAQAYPLVGMQSNLDPDYIEYQILSAKAAGIDGFFIEWGFYPHENDVLLKAMQDVASRYGFEIGVNWCDGWLYYDWITKIYPEIDTREEKTRYMAECWRYLVDSVFSVSTAPVVNGHPVFYHFGPGASSEEFRRILDEVEIPEHTGMPVGLRRWADWGTIENGRYIPVTWSEDMESWKGTGEIPTAWLPARVRPGNADYPYWDNYATEEDVIEFMKPFRDSIWLSDDPRFVVKSGFVMPGMDNRGCAGWGRGHFFLIPRNDGRTYDDMWKFCMECRDSLDMVFIASWSDYTEGHEIEPTVENGDRELRTTLKYSSVFKGQNADSSGLVLPLKLFRLRKDSEFLSACGVGTDMRILDRAAAGIAGGRYDMARRLLKKASERISVQMSGIVGDTVRFAVQAPAVMLPEGMAERLNNHHYRGYITFEYLDEGRDFLFIKSDTEKTPEENFSTVGKLRTDGTGEWKTARIELPSENITYVEGEPAFRFSSGVRTRDVSLEYIVYYTENDRTE